MTQKLTNFEPILGFKIVSKMGPKLEQKGNKSINQDKLSYKTTSILNSIFNVLRDHFWYPFWNPILEPDLPKKQQDEPKRAIRSFKDQKTAFSKPLKNTWFLHVFGSRGLPREPQEAQEGSQEAPKELLNPKKKGSKIDPKINKFWTNFGVQNCFKNGPKTRTKR